MTGILIFYPFLCLIIKQYEPGMEGFRTLLKITI